MAPYELSIELDGSTELRHRAVLVSPWLEGRPPRGLFGWASRLKLDGQCIQTLGQIAILLAGTFASNLDQSTCKLICQPLLIVWAQALRAATYLDAFLILA